MRARHAVRVPGEIKFISYMNTFLCSANLTYDPLGKYFRSSDHDLLPSF
jgi:hypothetical protein